MANKKQTDEFLDWLAAGEEAVEETLKHQMGRHNQQRHGWRYGDRFEGDERATVIVTSGNRIWRKGGDYQEYGRRVSNPKAAQSRAAARERSARRREEARAAARIAGRPPLGSRNGHAQPNPQPPARRLSSEERASLRAQHQRELEAHDRLQAVQAAQAAQAAHPVAAKPAGVEAAGVEAKKKPKTLPNNPYRPMSELEAHIARDRDINQQFLSNLNLRGVTNQKTLARQLSRTFEIYDKESGLRTRINTVVESHGKLRVEGDFMKDGHSVGVFTREFHRDGDGRLLVHHNYFRLDKAYEGTGVGSRFVRHLEQKYKKMGVNQIYLMANLDVGGYAWARMGFDFVNKSDLSRFTSDARSTWMSHYGSAMPSSIVKSLKHSWDIAALRGPDGYNIGKSVLLGENWDAAKILNGGPMLGFRIGEAYYDGKK